MARFLLLFILALPLVAAEPRVSNAKLEWRSAAAGLEKEFRTLVESQAGPAWIGYAAPLVPGRHQMCCFNSGAVAAKGASLDAAADGGSCCGGCSLEGSKTVSTSAEIRNPVKLEGPAEMLVLFRVEQKKVEKVRTFTEECELDAGGLPFYWLTDARPAESVALLASFATAAEGDTREGRRLSEGALSALALHGDPAADRALEGFVAPSQPEKLRERTAFWLGVARGRRGYEVLLRMARHDPSAHVRGQALFWLAHKAGRKAAEAITQAIEQDPETEVKKRAVFALSQLPKDEGVPLLIQVARTNRNPAVRKQAFFWLGQSRDPRALAFLEEVLTKP